MTFLSEAEKTAIKIAFSVWNGVDKQVVQRAIDQMEKQWG